MSRSPVVDSLLALRDGRDPAARVRELSFVSDANVEARIRYGELAELAVARAAALRALDLRPGELVMLSYPTSIDWIALFLGCVLAGVVPCTMPMPGKRLVDTTSHVIDVAAGLYRPRAIFAADDLLEALRAMSAAQGTRIIGQAEVARASTAGVTPLLAPRAAGDPHHVQLTSGSVAHPKAAVISHAGVWSNVQGVLGALGSDSVDDSTVLWLPTHHDMGLITLLTNLHFTSTMQLLQPSSFVRNPLGWLKRIAIRRATVTVAPTFALRYCLRRFNAERMAGVDLSSLRNFVVGAEHVDPETVDEFARTFAPYGLCSAALQPCYGMAETTLASTMQRVGTRAEHPAPRPAMAFVRPDEHDGKLRLSVGVPIAGMAVEIRSPDGNALGERAAGEIMLRGSSVMSGYLPMAGQPPLASPIGADGWLATGDIGYLAGGELFILGRMKEIIIIRGCNYFPDEIEAAVADHAAICKDGCAAIGVHDATQGTEQLVLMVEAAPEHVIAQARGELQALLLQRIGFAAHDLVFVSPGALPRTTSGKLQRLKCRSIYLDRRATEARR